jgi:hypothetical protein
MIPKRRMREIEIAFKFSMTEEHYRCLANNLNVPIQKNAIENVIFERIGDLINTLTEPKANPNV